MAVRLKNPIKIISVFGKKCNKTRTFSLFIIWTGRTFETKHHSCSVKGYYVDLKGQH